VKSCEAGALRGLFHRAGERDVPDAAYFGPVARKVEGPKSAASEATTA